MGLEEANTALTAALHVSESSDRPSTLAGARVFMRRRIRTMLRACRSGRRSRKAR